MTNVFAVAGEHLDDPRKLLLAGDDGRFYALDASGRPVLLDSIRDWRLDPSPAPTAEVERGGKSGKRWKATAARGEA